MSSRHFELSCWKQLLKDAAATRSRGHLVDASHIINALQDACNYIEAQQSTVVPYVEIKGTKYVTLETCQMRQGMAAKEYPTHNSPNLYKFAFDVMRILIKQVDSE